MQRLSRLSKVQFYTGNYLDGFPGGATWETGGTIQHQLWPNGYRNWVPGFWHVLTHWWTWFGCVFLRCFCLLSESAVVSFFPAVDRFLQNPWADERPQHPQLLCSENRGRVLTHSMCLPQEHMIYHHIIIMFPLKHPFGGGENGRCTHCDELLFPGNPPVSESVNIARWCFWRFQKSYQ